MKTRTKQMGKQKRDSKRWTEIQNHNYTVSGLNIKTKREKLQDGIKKITVPNYILSTKMHTLYMKTHSVIKKEQSI